MKKFPVIIIGAGPAGTTCAYELAKAGYEVLIFDHKAPWDKPCGGMLSPGTFDEFHILANYSGKAVIYDNIKLCTSREKLLNLSYTKPVFVVSRYEFNMHLLEKAVQAGVIHFKERVESISKTATEWLVVSEKGEYRAGIIIGADGAKGLTRRTLARKFDDSELAITCGYKVSGTEAVECFMKFYDFHGYCWYFKNSDFASIGIGCRINSFPVKELFSKLDEFIDAYYPQAKIKEKYSAFIPGIINPEFYNEPCSGDSWILAGDAAGHVLSPTSEGIYYSMKSGLAAAQSVIGGDINNYKSQYYSFIETLKKAAEFHSSIISLADDFGQEIYGSSIYKFLKV